MGAILKSLCAASRRECRRPRIALGSSLIVFGGALLILGLSRWLPLTLLLLALAGSMTVCYMALTDTLLLAATSPALQGRVMSLTRTSTGA